MATRPFVAALQAHLQQRLPSDEFQQIMEESRWEYEKLGEDERRPQLNQAGRYSRFSIICVSFYRAMLNVGVDQLTAFDTISKASSNLDWSPVPPQTSESCIMVEAFQSRDTLPLCEAVYCRKCPRNANGCLVLSRLRRRSL